MTLDGRRIVVGVTGGIAAYKAAELARLLIKAGAEVRVVMTAAAQAFVAPLTFQALTGNPVHVDLLDTDAEAAMGHIELARWAEHVVVAPASADFVARLSAGMADDLLATTCLATEAPLTLAPAMNGVMWANAATRDNIAKLVDRGVAMVGPASGDQACGETGVGRMVEPADLVTELSSASGALAGIRAVVTAGPTFEDLDPVRFLGNRSSGKMGFALAGAAASAGADVTLIAGPVSLATPPTVRRVDVRSARDMLQAVERFVDQCDLFISAAAVADYRPVAADRQKIKKSQQDSTQLSVALTENPDILRQVCAMADGPYTVGFAAETDNVLDAARQKRKRKGADMIVANQVGGGLAFDQDENAAVAIWSQGEQSFERQPKTQLARRLIRLVAQQINPSSDDSVTRLNARNRSQTA